MYITLSTENKLVLEAFKKEALAIKQEATELSISLLIELKTILFQFVLSYKEYSLTNIRAHGLTEILMQRALRFFKLDGGEESPIKSTTKPKKKWNQRVRKAQETELTSKTNTAVKTKKKRGYKYIFKRILKVILFPFYLLILALGMLLQLESKQKSNKYVKNTYKE